jgi:uncharacterized protein YbjT (DUF2867 family)
VTVLVVGATGTVGPHVVRALAARREPARVLARDAGTPGPTTLASSPAKPAPSRRRTWPGTW